MRIVGLSIILWVMLIVFLVTGSGCGPEETAEEVEEVEEVETVEEEPEEPGEIVSVKINELVADPVEEGEEIKLTSSVKVENAEDEDLIYTWSAAGGYFDDDQSEDVTWTAPEEPEIYKIELRVEVEGGNALSDEILVIVGEVEGLLFDHKLTMEEDHDELTMEVLIRNINTETLQLEVTGTIYGNIADIAGPDEKLFDFIKYNTMTATNLDGESLNFSRQGRRISSDTLDDYNYDRFFNIDNLDLDTGQNKTVLVEYELVDREEIWKGFGTDLDEFNIYNKTDRFWSAIKEWFILRPRDHSEGLIRHNYLEIDLPDGWNYAATYPDAGPNKIDLGELEFMRWTNDLFWKNYQRAPIMLFEEGYYLLEAREVAGVLLQDVYDADLEGRRNHEANHHFVSFISDYVGPLPVEKVLTFQVSSGGHAVNHFGAYQRAPYSYGYSTLGQQIASAGADIGHGGEHMQEPHRWCIERHPDDEISHLPNLWGTVRLWFGTIIKGHHIDPGLAVYVGDLAVDSYYEDWDVIENRYKPMYEFYLEHVVQDRGREVDVNAYTGHQFLTYFKPALGFLYLDLRIQEETNGEKDLSHAARYIFQEELEGRNTAKSWGEAYDTLVEALYHTVEEGINFEEKVQGYIMGDSYGQQFIDLSDYLDIDLEEYGL